MFVLPPPLSPVTVLQNLNQRRRVQYDTTYRQPANIRENERDPRLERFVYFLDEERPRMKRHES